MIEDVSDSDSGLPLSKRKRRLIRNMATATSSEIISSILSKSESQDVNAGVAAAAAVVDEEVEEEDEVLTDWELTLDPAPTVTTAATVARICSKKSVIILLPKTCALVLQARRIVREYLEVLKN